MCIEYDGRQHFMSIERWGGVKEFKLRKIKDEIKTIYCAVNNIQLLRIHYMDNIEDKINSLL